MEVCIYLSTYLIVIIRSAGANKTAELIYQALLSLKGNLNNVQLFYTDSGKEFDNKLFSEALETFCMKPSLSMKEFPYDNEFISLLLNS